MTWEQPAGPRRGVKFLKQKKTTVTIGLDIGSYSIKYVEMSHDKDVITLHQAKLLPLSTQSPESLKASLQTLVPPPAASARVRISVSGQSLLIRRIKLPVMTQADLKGAIRYEAESHIPFPVDDCVLDFQILNQLANEKMMNVLLVAAKRDFIQERLKILEESKWRSELIDVDIFCLLNSFERLSQQESGKVYGLLNIGHQTSSFAIIHDKIPFFMREIPLGGVCVTNALAESKSVPEEDADKQKKSRLPEQIPELQAATQKGLEPLIEELEHSIDYFENEAGADLNDIFLSGGGAMSVGGLEFLSQELKRKVALWDSTKKMVISKDINPKFMEEHSLEFTVAFGMGLRGLGSK